jgi:hypothetical protein
MKRQLMVLSCFLLILGCQRPEVEAFRQRPVPIQVKMEVPGSIPGSEAIKREYEAALRSRLATRVPVLVDGAANRPDSAELLVVVTDIRPSRRDPSAAAVGVATGLAVGALSAITGHRDAVFDGVWWGLWVGSNAAADRRAERRALGYQPNRISAVVHLRQAAPEARGGSITLAEFDVDGHEVIESMGPLDSSEREDLGRVREEEARALARVVVRKLQDRFGWSVKEQPEFLGLPKAPEPQGKQP